MIYLIAGLGAGVAILVVSVILFMLGFAGVCNMLARGEYGDDKGSG